MNALEGIPYLEVSRFLVREFLKVGYMHWPGMLDGDKVSGHLFEAFTDQALGEVRLEFLYQGIDTARVVSQAVIDVPRILFLQPVFERHGLHDDEGGARRSTSTVTGVPFRMKSLKNRKG